MAKKIIITIARQFGSGGREIGEKVAKILGIPCYDKELIKDAAAKGSLNEEVLKTTDESAANSLLYTLAMGSNVLGAAHHFNYKMPLNDKLFILQSEIIKEYAEAGSCVIIGRCADYVLEDREDLFKIFIYGDIQHREARIRERYPDIKTSQVLDVINKTDKRRASYYEYYSSQRWGSIESYDYCLDSSYLGIGRTVELIQAMVAHKEHPIPSPTEIDPTRPNKK